MFRNHAFTTTVHALAITAGLLVGAAALAKDYTAGDLKISHPTSRPTALAGLNGAGYVSIQNTGKTADTLIGATSDVASKIEIHEMSMTGGVMRMRELPQGVKIPAGGSASLDAGGAHLMLLSLKRALVAGETVPVTLEFAKAGKVPVELQVEPIATDADKAMPHQHGG